MFLAIVTLCALAFVIATGNLTHSTNKLTAYKVGEPAQINNVYKITVDSAKTDDAFAQKMRLPDDQTLTIIHAKITNLSTQDLNYLPSLHSYLRDSQGDTYVILADVSQPALPPKILKPGESIEGNLAFVTQKRHIPLWLYFDTHFQNQTPVVFQISS